MEDCVDLATVIRPTSDGGAVSKGSAADVEPPSLVQDDLVFNFVSSYVLTSFASYWEQYGIAPPAWWG